MRTFVKWVSVLIAISSVPKTLAVTVSVDTTSGRLNGVEEDGGKLTVCLSALNPR